MYEDRILLLLPATDDKKNVGCSLDVDVGFGDYNFFYTWASSLEEAKDISSRLNNIEFVVANSDRMQNSELVDIVKDIRDLVTQDVHLLVYSRYLENELDCRFPSYIFDCALEKKEKIEELKGDDVYFVSRKNLNKIKEIIEYIHS